MRALTLATLTALLLGSSGCATPALYDWFEDHRRARATVTAGPPATPIAVTRAGRGRDGTIYVEVQYRSPGAGASLRRIRYAPAEAGCPDPAWPSAGGASEEGGPLTADAAPWPDEALIPVAVVSDPDDPGVVPPAALSLERDAARSLPLDLGEADEVPPAFAVRLAAGALELREGAGAFRPIGRVPSLPGRRHETPGERRVGAYLGFALALPFAAAADVTIGAVVAAGYVAAVVPMCCFAR